MWLEFTEPCPGQADCVVGVCIRCIAAASDAAFQGMKPTGFCQTGCIVLSALALLHDAWLLPLGVNVELRGLARCASAPLRQEYGPSGVAGAAKTEQRLQQAL